MSIYGYESAFGAWDQTSKAMRSAIENWFSLYYGKSEGDPAQRIAYTVVTKLTKTVFGEYKAVSKDKNAALVLEALNKVRKQAVQQALIGGECYLKPYPKGDSFAFTLIPRNNLLVFARDPWGMPTDVGTVEKTVGGKCYYTLLERRKVDEKGYLTIENRLYKSLNADTLGGEVSLGEVPAYEALPACYTYPQPVGSVGLVQV